MTEDGTGSEWYFPVFEGLFDAKHVEQMGPAIWLYGWILARAYVARREGSLVYSHADARTSLAVSDKTVRIWFERLQEYGYLTTRARKPHSLDVQVSNWRSVEQWLEARTAAGERSVISYHSGVENGKNLPITETENGKKLPTGKVIGNVIGKNLPILPLTIKLSSYEYPVVPLRGTGFHPNLAEAFQGLLGVLKVTSNKGGVLHEIYALCLGEPVPDYGYLGRVAREVGGAGRLAELLWQLSTRPPTGDVLAYILATAKRGVKVNGNGNGRKMVGQMTDEEWDEAMKSNRLALGISEEGQKHE